MGPPRHTERSQAHRRAAITDSSALPLAPRSGQTKRPRVLPGAFCIDAATDQPVAPLSRSFLLKPISTRPVSTSVTDERGTWYSPPIKPLFLTFSESPTASTTVPISSPSEAITFQPG